MALYDEPFWRADGLSGEAVTDAGPVTLTFDSSPRDGSPGVMLGFVGGPEARELAALAPGERRAAVLACFERLYGPRAAQPLDYAEQAWAAEQWSGGGPTSNFGPGGWTACGPALREPARSHPLGGHRDRHGLERLHGGRSAGRRPRRGRGAAGHRLAGEQLEARPTVQAIDREITVEREDALGVAFLGEGNERGVRQVHRSVCVTLSVSIAMRLADSAGCSAISRSPLSVSRQSACCPGQPPARPTRYMASVKAGQVVTSGS